jgi:hypothetical protein
MFCLTGGCGFAYPERMQGAPPGMGMVPGPGPGPGGPPAAADPGKIKNAKLARGCGGCGCAFALLSSIAGTVLIIFGMQRATREAMPFGIIFSGLALPAAIIGGILLFVGISNLKKLGA